MCFYNTSWCAPAGVSLKSFSFLLKSYYQLKEEKQQSEFIGKFFTFKGEKTLAISAPLGIPELAEILSLGQQLP